MAAQEMDEFKLARQRAQQDANANLARQKDAMTRRFAQLGNLNSGARLKMEQQAESANQEALGRANESIDVAERGENRRVREMNEARQFAKDERLGSQQFAKDERLGSQHFAAEQAGLGRQFSRDERLGSQQFAGDQAALARRFQTSEREAGQGFAAGESALARAQQDRQFGEQMGFQRDQAREQVAQYHNTMQFQDRQFKEQIAQYHNTFREQVDQFRATFGEEVRISNKNIEFAEKMANEKGFIESIGSGAKNFFSMPGVKGAAAGAAIGSVVPGLGTVIGGGIGYLGDRWF